MQNLQDHEIQANFDFANWQASVEAENRTHNAELERKNSYVSKLNVDLDVAKTFEQLSQKEWDQSVKALQDAVNDLEAKRAYYLAETNRRNEENAILDEVLEIFRSKVAGIADYLRTRAEGSTERVARATDNQISSQSGNIAEQVAAEARQA